MRINQPATPDVFPEDAVAGCCRRATSAGCGNTTGPLFRQAMWRATNLVARGGHQSIDFRPAGIARNVMKTGVLVAFTIECDSEFERRMPHRTTNHGSGLPTRRVTDSKAAACQYSSDVRTDRRLVPGASHAGWPPATPPRRRPQPPGRMRHPGPRESRAGEPTRRRETRG